MKFPNEHLQLIRYGFYINAITKLIGEKGARPRRPSRGGYLTARGKRVPVAEIRCKLYSHKKTGGKLDFFKFVYSLSNSLIRNAFLNELTDALLHHKGAVTAPFLMQLKGE